MIPLSRSFRYLVCLVLLLLVSGCHVGRFFVWNFADIRDHKKFPSLPLKASSTPFQFAKRVGADTLLDNAPITIGGKTQPLRSLLEANDTRAFLIIRNDTIQYETYFEGYAASSIVPSFSVAKSVTSALVGIAIAEGRITSADDTLGKYLPELRDAALRRVTLTQLLDMQSGLDYNEGYYNPFGHVAKFYYGTNLTKASQKLDLASPPGTTFDYKSGNTQLLGLVLERATGQHLPEYLQAKLWTPMGMEFDASWSVDSKQHQVAKAFCCLNARAYDFAKFGRLYLNKGNWNGQQLVPAAWVDRSVGKTATHPLYNYQWWRSSKPYQFKMEGILGQFVFVDPTRNLIIVRLGAQYGKLDWDQLFDAIASAMPEKAVK